MSDFWYHNQQQLNSSVYSYPNNNWSEWGNQYPDFSVPPPNYHHPPAYYSYPPPPSTSNFTPNSQIHTQQYSINRSCHEYGFQYNSTDVAPSKYSNTNNVYDYAKELESYKYTQSNFQRQQKGNDEVNKESDRHRTDEKSDGYRRLILIIYYS